MCVFPFEGNGGIPSSSSDESNGSRREIETKLQLFNHTIVHRSAAIEVRNRSHVPMAVILPSPFHSRAVMMCQGPSWCDSIAGL